MKSFRIEELESFSLVLAMALLVVFTIEKVRVHSKLD